MVRSAGALMMGIGAILFISAALFPVSFRVFPEPAPARKLERITASPVAWSIAQVLFGLGATLPIVGVALLVTTPADRLSAGLLLASVTMLVFAVVPWIMHLGVRAANPAAFAAGELPVWHLAVYFLLTPVGIAVFGVAMLTSGLLAPWVGWVIIGSMAVVLAITAITRDMVPGVYYLVTLLPVVMLLLQ